MVSNISQFRCVIYIGNIVLAFEAAPTVFTLIIVADIGVDC